MAGKIHLVQHIGVEELEYRYKAEPDGIRRSHLQIIWLLAQGRTAKFVASVTGYSPSWISTILWRYNDFSLGVHPGEWHGHKRKPGGFRDGPAAVGSSWTFRASAAGDSAMSALKAVSHLLSWWRPRREETANAITSRTGGRSRRHRLCSRNHRVRGREGTMLGRTAPERAGSGPARAPTPKNTPANDRPGAEPAIDGAVPTAPLRLTAAYARVSSDTQEKEQTIDSQLEALRRGAAERNLRLTEEFIFRDDGFSGARLDRPGLDRLRDALSEGTCTTLLVSAPDRLARHFAYQALLLEEFQRAGCEVIFLNHAFDASPEQQMLLQMQGVFAEYERALIQERTRRGRLFAARQGRVNWGGRPPYGYRCVRQTETAPQSLEIDETEAAVVLRMYRWLVDEQLSSHAIQHRLIDGHVPTRAVNGQGWCQSTVIKILRNPLYKGEAWYNRTQRGDVRRPRMASGMKDVRPGNGRGRILRPHDDWIPVAVPALVDADLWRMAQEQLARNRERARRHNTKHDYLLRGLLVCGHCGRRLVGTWSTLGGRYICSARYPRTAAWACDGRSVSAPRVEQQVWDYIRPLLSDPDLLRCHYQDSRGDPAIDSRDERERVRLERQIAVATREVQRLIDAYQSGAIDLAELQERRQRSDEHTRFLRQRVADIERQRCDREQEIRLLQGLEAFCSSVRDALADPSFAVKQQVLQLVIDRIVIEDTRIVIKHVIPVEPVGLRPRHHLCEFLR
jgi:site-specific DNA recombinase